jgi:hypothetical protein
VARYASINQFFSVDEHIPRRLIPKPSKQRTEEAAKQQLNGYPLPSPPPPPPVAVYHTKKEKKSVELAVSIMVITRVVVHHWDMWDRPVVVRSSGGMEDGYEISGSGT